MELAASELVAGCKGYVIIVDGTRSQGTGYLSNFGVADMPAHHGDDSLMNP